MKALEDSIRCRLENLLKFRGSREIHVESYVKKLRNLPRKLIKDEKAESAAKIFSALSDPVRVKILKLLEKRNMCVCELVIALDMKQPAVSYHLKLLQDCELIKPVKTGKWVFYEISNKKVASLISRIIDSA